MQTGQLNVSSPQQRAYIVAAADLMMKHVLKLCLIVFNHNRKTIAIVDDVVMKNVIVSLTVDEYVVNLHKMLFILLGNDDDSKNTIEVEEAAILLPIAVQLQELAIQRPNILTSDCKNVAENIINESFEVEGGEEEEEIVEDDDEDVELSVSSPETDTMMAEENCECITCTRYTQAACGEIVLSESFRNSPLFTAITKIL